MTDQVGRVLGDRYRIIAPIGAGASALVFLADDVVLKRQVAVKLLHEGLTADQRFLERFRSEAQTTASLNHQHLVAVYDWGFDDVPYLVTEYLAGGSLQTILDQGVNLTRSQALLVGLEASRALEYAHRRGLIHRDIKPSNLLFDEDGRLRIADFGLARALAEASITEPIGAVLGSARYASPEQARGEQVDGKSDIYSLALVLIEAVTGTLPFASDTVVGTLMGRIDNPVTVPEEMGPLHAPLSRAGVVDPTKRPDAGDFATSILATAELLPRPEPLPLVGALNTPVGYELSPTDMGTRPDPDDSEPDDPAAIAAGTGDGAHSGDEADTDGEAGAVDDGGSGSGLGTGLGLTAGAAAAAGITGANRGGSPQETDDDTLLPTRPLFFDPIDPALVDDKPAPASGAPDVADAAQTSTMAPVAADPTVLMAPVDAEAPAVPLSRRQSRRAAKADSVASGSDRTRVVGAAEMEDARDDHASLLWILGGFLIVLALGFGVWTLWQSSDVADPIVPELAGRTFDELGPLIGENGWEVQRLEGREDGSVVGEIIDQDPGADTPLAAGEELRVTISLGNAMVPIPDDLLGVRLEDATRRLDAVGLVAGDTTEVPDELIPVGNVVRVNEPEFSLPRGAAVDLVVSQGPVPRFVPDDLVGLSVADATTRLQDLRLDPVVQSQYSYEVELDTVMRVSPDPGTEVTVGTQVGLLVSLGPEPIEVPETEGLELAEALDLFEAAGLCVGDTVGRTADDAEILQTDPQGGDIVTDPDDCVRIVTSIIDPDDEDDEDS